MFTRYKARRYATERDLGVIIGIVRLPATWITMLIAWPVPIFGSILTFVRPVGSSTLPMDVSSAVIFVLLGLMLHRVLNGERLVVCERGVLMGYFLPLLRPFAIRYDQIDTATLVFLSNFTNLGHLVGNGFSSSRRAYHGHDVALSFAGPKIEDALVRPGGFNDSYEMASTGGVMWAFGCGNRRRARVAELLLAALTPRLGPSTDSLRRQLSQTIPLSRDPHAIICQVPGLVSVASRPDIVCDPTTLSSGVLETH